MDYSNTSKEPSAIAASSHFELPKDFYFSFFVAVPFALIKNYYF